MTSGFNELSLMLFTSLAPGGIIAFIIMAIARLRSPDPETSTRIDRMISLPFIVVLIGFIASATHLGTPANALHVFAGIGRSPLSNEVFSAVIFLFLAGAYWMAAFKENFPNVIAKPWLVLACLAGIVLIINTSLAYSVDTVPTWNTCFTPANLVLGALYSGAILGILFLQTAKTHSPHLNGVLLIVSTITLAAGTLVLLSHCESLTSIQNNEFSADTLVPYYESLIAYHTILGIGSIIAAGWGLKKAELKNFHSLALLVIASILAISSIFVVRIAFYSLHMTVGF